MANYIVTTLVDEEYDGGETVGAPDGTGLSLREALELALLNGAGTADTITFDASLAGETLTLAGSNLVLSSDVTIDGDIDGDDVADITVDGDGASRVFNVTGGTSTLESLIIANGDAGASNGGGIFVGSAADLTISNATIAGNSGNNGGGIENLGSLTLIGSTLSDNSAAHDGGGLRTRNDATTTLVNVTVSGNVAAEDGGGVFNATGGTMTLVNTTVSGNVAVTGNGGGMRSEATPGIGRFGDPVEFHRGGQQRLRGRPGDLTTSNRTFYSGANIVGDTFTIDGGSPQSGIALTDIFAAVVSVDPGGTGAFNAGELADNGGSVETIALNRDVANPAIDSGDATFLDEATLGTDLNGDGDMVDVITTDARGLDRDVDFDGGGGTPDLGAFEVQVDAELVVTTLLDSGDDATVTGDLAAEMADGGGLSLREALILANADFDGDPTNATNITFDASLEGTITLNGTALTVAADVTIDGDTDGDGKADITIDANGGSRVFNVTEGTSTVELLVITGGDAGGGKGGGINVGSAASLTVENSTISGNDGYNGGGIYTTGALTLVGVSLTGNSADYIGGGLASYTGTTTLTNVTVSGNQAHWAGGISVGWSGVAALTNVTVTGNTAATSGGGVYSAYISDTTFTNTIVAGNDAPDSADVFAGAYNGSAATMTYSGGNIVGDTLTDDGVGPADRYRAHRHLRRRRHQRHRRDRRPACRQWRGGRDRRPEPFRQPGDRCRRRNAPRRSHGRHRPQRRRRHRRYHHHRRSRLRPRCRFQRPRRYAGSRRLRGAAHRSPGRHHGTRHRRRFHGHRRPRRRDG